MFTTNQYRQKRFYISQFGRQDYILGRGSERAVKKHVRRFFHDHPFSFPFAIVARERIQASRWECCFLDEE